MFITYSTDAPIYHRPIATIAMIVLNVLAFGFALLVGEEVSQWFMLQYGYFRPWQWITSNFMHAGPMHLIGNMIGVWAFGLLVEGKVGWWKFLAIYFGIGFVQCGIEQTVGLFIGHGGSLGASSIVFGLIGIALVWSPKNDMNCVWVVTYQPYWIDLQVSTLASIQIGMQLLVAGLGVASGTTGLGFTTEILHLMGAALGVGIGVAMLLTKQVDCEGWDVFSVMRGDHLLSADEKRAKENSPETIRERMENRRIATLEKIREHLKANQPGMAKAAHVEARQFTTGWVLPEAESAELIDALQRRGQWNDALDLMLEYLRTHRERAVTVRYHLAQLLLDKLNRPLQAVRVLDKFNGVELKPSVRAAVEQLQEVALQRAEDDPYEVVQDW